LVGGGRLAWPVGAVEDEQVPWLVFGGMVRAVAMDAIDPGLRGGSATLEEEGFESDAGSAQLVESFARHLMLALDAWQGDGFAAVARPYLTRLLGGSGSRRSIDENGDLLVRPIVGDTVERRSLVEALMVTAWLDPQTGTPRL
jgi:hypothetical protein